MYDVKDITKIISEFRIKYLPCDGIDNIIKRYYKNEAKSVIKSLESSNSASRFIINIKSDEDWKILRSKWLDVLSLKGLLDTSPLLKDKLSTNLTKYINKLEKIFVKIPDDYDQETNINLVEKLSKHLNNYFKPLIISCHRGISNPNCSVVNKNVYNSFINSAYAYLEKLGLERINVEVGKKIPDEVINYGGVSYCDNSRKKNIVSEIECLPFWLFYINDEGEEDSRYIEGEIIAYR